MRNKGPHLSPVLTLLVAALVVASPSRAEDSQATLPLPELLKLYKKSEDADRQAPTPQPPVQAAIHRLDLAGRLLDGAVDLTAHYEVVVLDADGWVSLPLLTQDADTHLSFLPEIPGAAFVVQAGQLTFVTRTQGVYKFKLSFLKHAQLDGRKRRVRLRHGAATLARCEVAFDEGIFRLTTAEIVKRSDGVLIFPRDGAFDIAWERTGDAVAAATPAARPEIESVIQVAHASTVSTLEGVRITRLRYQLRFAGNKPIEIQVPGGSVVERAYLNGVSLPVEVQGTRLALQVSPAREGDEAGVLELVLSGSGGAFHLSGALQVELPRVSWPVNRLYLDVHLPQVFNYRWTGGSLSPLEASPAVSYTYDVPLPGKSLSFHQPLITSSAPSLTLGYAVDLDGHYFQP